MSVAPLFPGQGSQAVGSNELIASSPEAKRVFAEADDTLGSKLSELSGPRQHGAFIAGCAAAAALLVGCEERCRDTGTELTVLDFSLDAEPTTPGQFVDPPSGEFPGAGTLQVESADDSSFRVIGRGTAFAVDFAWSGVREDGSFLVGDGAAIQFSFSGEPASRGSFAIRFSSFEPPRFDSTFDVSVERDGVEVPATGELNLVGVSFEGACGV